MKILKAGIEILNPVDPKKMIKILEQCGRVCYKSERKITEDSAERFIKMLIGNGHESVLEHGSITVRFICNRAISHEIVRHRIASYSQESTRYCNYAKNDFGGEITVIEPCFLKRGTYAYDLWEKTCKACEDTYFKMLDYGLPPEQARGILPHDLKTELVDTKNIREWRHFLRLRCSEKAHPQMRELALRLLVTFYTLLPVCFEDIWKEYYKTTKEENK